ncbi:MAG: hypothetical protein NC489_28625 [Ruminococcus flavefaciens]|nr:hypothetical protein [Ruminococcus flavefaciens]
MRKRIPLIRYLRHNPRHYRFPLPNSIWEYNLKPIEFVVLSYLCYLRSHDRNGAFVSAEAIAKAVYLTGGTVKKYLSSLVAHHLRFGKRDRSDGRARRSAL